MMKYGYYMMPWGSLFWFISLILIIVIGIAVYKITTSGRNNQNRTINGSSVEILKQRFARGEIDEEQYKKMRDTIESKK
jgi:putative membrane protein